MKKTGNIILTNMCMLYRKDGSFLVENRKKQDWPGLNFPGGHVEKDESILHSVVREIQEETGLTVEDPEFVSYYEWNLPEEGVRHLCLLFRASKWHGELHSSKEGEVFFITKNDLASYPLATDFDKILAICAKGLTI